MNKRYAVGIEICHVLTEVEARRLAEKIRDRLSDMDEDIYVCVTEYEQVGFRNQITDFETLPGTQPHDMLPSLED